MERVEGGREGGWDGGVHIKASKQARNDDVPRPDVLLRLFPLQMLSQLLHQQISAELSTEVTLSAMAVKDGEHGPVGVAHEVAADEEAVLVGFVQGVRVVAWARQEGQEEGKGGRKEGRKKKRKEDKIL